MLKRQIGEEIKINPYYNTTATIVDTKYITTDEYFNKNYDYKAKWNQRMENGCGEYEFFNETELDKLENNWYMVKGSKKCIL